VSQDNHRHRRAVILAGGDDTRLKTLTRAIAGDELPKQFCPVIGESTLLEKTQRHVALLMNPVQTFTIVTRTHERFYRNHLKHWPTDRLLRQPENRGTAPAILLSLLGIRQLSPEAVVAFFPSDHHFTDETSRVLCRRSRWRSTWLKLTRVRSHYWAFNPTAANNSTVGLSQWSRQNNNGTRVFARAPLLGKASQECRAKANARRGPVGLAASLRKSAR
jgi:hypothetical protein